MALGLIGAGMSIAGGVAKLFGLGEKKISDMPEPELAKLVKLKDYPASPERDALIKNYSSSYKQASEAYTKGLSEIDPAISAYSDTVNPLISGVSGLSATLETLGNKNPYLDYWSNPAETEAKYKENLAKGIESTYGDYGAKGTAFAKALTDTRSNAARRGILNSGVSRQQEAELDLKRAAEKTSALSAADQQAMNYLTTIAGLYNQGKSLQANILGQAADTKLKAAKIAKSIPSLKMDAAKQYGLDYLNFGARTSDLEKQARDEKQQVNLYNTQTQQNINNANTAAKNLANTTQWQTENAGKTGWADTLMGVGSNVMSIGKTAASGGFGSLPNISSLWGGGSNNSSSGETSSSNTSPSYGYGTSSSGSNYLTYNPYSYSNTNYGKDVLGMDYTTPTYSYY